MTLFAAVLVCAGVGLAGTAPITRCEIDGVVSYSTAPCMTAAPTPEPTITAAPGPRPACVAARRFALAIAESRRGGVTREDAAAATLATHGSRVPIVEALYASPLDELDTCIHKIMTDCEAQRWEQ